MIQINSDPAWDWQTITSLAAIAAGFALFFLEKWWSRRGAARAAAHLAKHSIEYLTDRLEALVSKQPNSMLHLRGARTTEMVETLRELDISLLPPKMINSVAVIRSGVHAVNFRINEVLIDDKKRVGERSRRLQSAGRTLFDVRTEWDTLCAENGVINGSNFKLSDLSSEMVEFISEARKAADAQ